MSSNDRRSFLKQAAAGIDADGIARKVHEIMTAHASGDPRRALHCLLSALWRNPLFLGRRQVVSVLWDCLLRSGHHGP